MVSVRILEIEGYQHEPIPNRFFQLKEEASDHLALLLPGKGYTCDEPVLYYPLLELVDRGIDVLSIDYARRPQIRSWSLEQAHACALADTTAAYQAIISQHAYTQLTLVGKSLGTLVMRDLLASHTFSIPEQQAIWLTPALSSTAMREQIRHILVPSLFVIGTDDPSYDTDWPVEVKQAPFGEAVIIPQADHTLDIGTDALRSLQAIEHMLNAVRAFLDRKK